MKKRGSASSIGRRDDFKSKDPFDYNFKYETVHCFVRLIQTIFRPPKHGRRRLSDSINR